MLVAAWRIFFLHSSRQQFLVKDSDRDQVNNCEHSSTFRGETVVLSKHRELQGQAAKSQVRERLQDSALNHLVEGFSPFGRHSTAAPAGTDPLPGHWNAATLLPCSHLTQPCKLTLLPPRH